MKIQYKLEHIREIYNSPFMDLVYRAMGVHREYHNPNGLKLCYAKSVKTGGCSENCAYCPQSAHWNTFVEKSALLSEEEIMEAAQEAKAAGVSRFCMGTAWSKIPSGKPMERLRTVIPKIRDMGLEVCCSMGKVDEEQIHQLRNAGCNVYNLNLDTSPEFYKKIITTRTYDERMETLKTIQSSGMNICCGGIIGMGETVDDRLKLLKSLSDLDPQPESIPLNILSKIPGTPLEHAAPVDWSEYVRIIAVTRIVLPKSIIGLAAGRNEMSEEMQTLCFMVGANSIITGTDTVLTTGNPEANFDKNLMNKLNLTGA